MAEPGRKDSRDAKLNLDVVLRAHEELLGLIEDPERRGSIERFANAARVYQERAIVDLLSQTLSAINEAGAGIQARLEYRLGDFVLSIDATEEATHALLGSEEQVERLTFRLPPRLKSLIEQAAGGQGISVNTWCLHALARAVYFQTRGRPNEWQFEARPGRKRRGRRRVPEQRGD